MTGAYPGSVYTSETGRPMMSGFDMMASSGETERTTRASPSNTASATTAVPRFRAVISDTGPAVSALR